MYSDKFLELHSASAAEKRRFMAEMFHVAEAEMQRVLEQPGLSAVERGVQLMLLFVGSYGQHRLDREHAREALAPFVLMVLEQLEYDQQHAGDAAYTPAIRVSLSAEELAALPPVPPGAVRVPPPSRFATPRLEREHFGAILTSRDLLRELRDVWSLARDVNSLLDKPFGELVEHSVDFRAWMNAYFACCGADTVFTPRAAALGTPQLAAALPPCYQRLFAPAAATTTSAPTTASTENAEAQTTQQ